MSETPAENTQLIKLQRRIPDADPALLQDMLDDAEAYILAYTGQPSLPDGLRSAQLRIASARYNALGLEGQSAHSEGGVSVSIESLPADLQRELDRYRIAKVGW